MSSKRIKSIKLLKSVVVNGSTFSTKSEVKLYSVGTLHSIIDGKLEEYEISKSAVFGQEYINQWLEDGRVVVEYFEVETKLPEFHWVGENYGLRDDLYRLQTGYITKSQAEALKSLVEASLKVTKLRHEYEKNEGLAQKVNDAQYEAFDAYQQYLTPTAE